MIRAAIQRGLGLGLLSALLGCNSPSHGPTQPPRLGSAAGPEAPAGYPGTLRDPAQMGPDIQWQQRVTARWQDDTQSFEAVLSKTDHELLLVGLSPMKTPGFIVRLTNGEVELENRSPQEVPFDPRYIMLDIQRVYFPWIPGEPPVDAERSHRVDGEQVTERWAQGQLRQRRFVREDGRPPGEITVTYEGWEDGQDAPRRAVLDNGWFGYTLEIETFVQQRL
ncbi:MAG: DUF3261 domain-containing protein [Myxococcota bacterium]